MKLKNKRTGEIMEFDAILPVKDVSGDSVAHLEYKSLTEFNEEWEDASEEPKDYYCIDWTEPSGVYKTRCEDERDEFNKEIGNYFKTKEEAEKAVERLRAWKRLKDKGFRFDKWCNVSAGPYKPIWFYFEKDTALEDVKSDLDLLFGGEE